MAQVNHNIFYELSPKVECLAEVDPEWIRTVYQARSCGLCHSLLPEWQGTQLDISMIGDLNGLLPSTLPMMIDLELMHKDLFGSLSCHMVKYAIGVVSVRGHINSDYLTAVSAPAVRIPQHGDDRSEECMCEECGRRCEILYGERWARRTDIGGAAVWSGVGGIGLHVREDLLRHMPPQLRCQLRQNMEVIIAR
jgi:hypothetical protein